MDGVIIINKEKGYTSNDIVRKVKGLVKEKVGHTGTLDPNAEGVLPILIGNGTKVSKYLINHDKEYEAVLKLGIKTTTADEEGEVIEKKEVDEKYLNNDELLRRCLNTFVGNIEQIPPIYSAIKVNGKKLYQYARSGQDVEIEPRKIEIYDIKLLDVDKENKTIRFYVKCSKGTYIRTLCEDIAKKVETVGYMKELKRISVGEFNIKNSIKLNELEEKINNGETDYLIKIEDLFDIEKIEIKDETDLNKYLNGVCLKCGNSKDGMYKVYYNSNFIGLGVVKDSKLKRDIVLQNMGI